MTNLVTVLALAEKAKEDMYFAEIDRQLVVALHARPDLDERHRREAERATPAAVTPERIELELF